jgi:hypothetical protein
LAQEASWKRNPRGISYPRLGYEPDGLSFIWGIRTSGKTTAAAMAVYVTAGRAAIRS